MRRLTNQTPHLLQQYRMLGGKRNSQILCIWITKSPVAPCQSYVLVLDIDPFRLDFGLTHSVSICLLDQSNKNAILRAWVSYTMQLQKSLSSSLPALKVFLKRSMPRTA